VGHKNPATAIITGIVDLFDKKGLLPGLRDDDRIDGRTCLVTGANSGLGKAVAIQLAQRGGHVLMACRGGHPDAGEDVRRISGSDRVEMLHVDLSDLESVNALCDELASRGVVLDIVVLNAGLMPLKARRTTQGFEVMFGVHFLANRVLIDRWLADGVLRPGADEARPPRIIFVSSEAHQSSEPIDFERFGEFVDYGLKDGMNQYGHTKLHMCTYAAELSRRLNPGEGVSVAVHSLCPGPIASNIARESPTFLKPLIGPIMKLFFRSPEKAAEPVLYLACAQSMQERSGAYLHMMREKSASALALDEENGRRLWEESEALLRDQKDSGTAGDTSITGS
jgi:NAD(P)-dependent dehydrogenase (short-subunit alcohol dehydrogenase family)